MGRILETALHRQVMRERSKRSSRQVKFWLLIRCAPHAAQEICAFLHSLFVLLQYFLSTPVVVVFRLSNYFQSCSKNHCADSAQWFLSTIHSASVKCHGGTLAFSVVLK